MSLSAALKIVVNAVLTGSIDLATQRAEQNVEYPLPFSDGAGAGQANVIFSDRRSIAASGNESLDLAGSLTNLLGAAASFARVKAVIIKASAGNTNSLVVTRPASNGAPFVDAEEKLFPDIPPGGIALWADPGATGVAITPTSADLINIANSGGGSAVEYEITVIGAAT